MEINDIKAIVKAFRLFHYDLRSVFRFIHLNFFSSNVRRTGGYLYIYPYVVWCMDKKAICQIHGDCHIGIPAIPGSKSMSFFVMRSSSVFTVNDKCEFLEQCDVQIHKGGKLNIDSFHSNIDLEISCGDSIIIGKDVTAGRHVRIKDFNGHKVDYEGYPIHAPIHISNHVWLCTGSTINPGVNIAYGAVIADNANVISDIASMSFNQGNPSRKIKSNITFEI